MKKTIYWTGRDIRGIHILQHRLGVTPHMNVNGEQTEELTEEQLQAAREMEAQGLLQIRNK